MVHWCCFLLLRSFFFFIIIIMCCRHVLPSCAAIIMFLSSCVYQRVSCIFRNWFHIGLRMFVLMSCIQWLWQNSLNPLGSSLPKHPKKTNRRPQRPTEKQPALAPNGREVHAWGGECRDQLCSAIVWRARRVDEAVLSGGQLGDCYGV